MFFVNSFIKVCKNAFSSDQLKGLLDELNDHPVGILNPVTGNPIWSQAKVYLRDENDKLSTVKSDRRSCDTLDSESSLYHWVMEVIEPIISKHLYDYIDHFGVELLKEQDNPYAILRYEAGQGSMLHGDEGVGVYRKVSCIMYINDDYTGGELFFDKQDYRLTPEAGDLVIFPSAFPYTHEAAKVKTGVKYCVVKFWA